MAGNELKVSPGLEDRLLEYATAAEALREHGASDRVALGLTAPEEFVTDMQVDAAPIEPVSTGQIPVYQGKEPGIL
jgi:hypothetical protein